MFSDGCLARLPGPRAVWWFGIPGQARTAGCDFGGNMASGGKRPNLTWDTQNRLTHYTYQNGQTQYMANMTYRSDGLRTWMQDVSAVKDTQYL